MLAAALGLLALNAACHSVTRPLPAESRGALAFAGLDEERHVTTLAKSEGARLPGAVASGRAEAAERASLVRMASLDQDPAPMRPRPIPPFSAPRGRAVTELVRFASAPFPYDGAVPGKGPFLDVVSGERRGHRTARGGVLWQDTTFADDRVLVHIPAGFDPRREAVLVVFYHGHGATLARDVRERQRIAEQVAGSGANAVLVAPQFAHDARDSSAGKFWEPGGFSRFLDEAATRLAALGGDRAAQPFYARMPVVLVSYSGGYVPAAWSLKDPEAARRVRGLVLLDSLYGEEVTFANWYASAPSAFFVSAHTRYTARRNAALRESFAARGLPAETALPDSLARGGAVFLATGAEVNHDDYCTQAWTENPLADILARLPELSLREPGGLAAIAGRRRSAVAEPR